MLFVVCGGSHLHRATSSFYLHDSSAALGQTLMLHDKKCSPLITFMEKQKKVDSHSKNFPLLPVFSEPLGVISELREPVNSVCVQRFLAVHLKSNYLIKTISPQNYAKNCVA